MSKSSYKIKERKDVPTFFRRGPHPAAKNVGELVDILSLLPRNLDLNLMCDGFVQVYVASVNGESAFICGLNGIGRDEYNEAKSDDVCPHCEGKGGWAIGSDGVHPTECGHCLTMNTKSAPEPIGPREVVVTEEVVERIFYHLKDVVAKNMKSPTVLSDGGIKAFTMSDVRAVLVAVLGKK